MPKHTREDAEKAERRRKVATFTLNHYDQVAIASMLGVHQSTISRDINYLLGQWRESSETDIKNHVARELAELNLMEKEAAANYFALKSEGNLKQASTWMTIRLNLKKQKADLLGLDKPKKLDVDASGQVVVNLTRMSCRKEDNVQSPE